MADLGSDLRAGRAGDLVTVLVVERSSASARAGTAASRTSSASGGVKSVFGPITSSRLTDLVNLSGNRELNGTGETTRENTLTTSMTAIVSSVLPNGDLMISGSRRITTNSEVQTIVLTGRIRPVDIGAGNTIQSERIAELAVAVNGKGVVNDAVRRPNILYRILLGLLPF
jgi:flagellar L-ring protein precursor FlgH